MFEVDEIGQRVIILDIKQNIFHYDLERSKLRKLW